MKIKEMFIYLIASLVGISFFACTDDSYDLSDIDSTVGVKVNDLTIPLNIDGITLKSVFDLDDDSQIREINGEYAFLEEGSFDSDPIEVPSFIIPAPIVAPIEETLDLVSYDISAYPVTIPDDFRLFTAGVSDASTSFNFEAQNIDPSLVKVVEIGTNFLVNIAISVNGLEALLDSVEFENLTIQLPKGLKATVLDQEGVYDYSTGVLTYTNFNLSYNSERNELRRELSLSVTKIDAIKLGLELANGELLLETSASLSGTFAIYGRNLKKPINMTEISNLEKLTYRFDIGFPNGDIEVTDFTGDIQYQLGGIEVSPVIIDNLPDILNQEGTDIRISNPQVYVSINNPLYNDYKLHAKASVELFPTPESNLTFESSLTFDNVENRFCLSPLKPENMYVAGSTHVPFLNMGNILSGDEIPSKIDIEFNPEVPLQSVTNFKLGQNLGTVEGSYVFYAPLALTDEARIHYTDTIDGWSDDELKQLAVDLLSVEAKIQSDVPFGLQIIVHPIDKNGKKLTRNGQPIEGKLQSVESNGIYKDILPAMANTNILLKLDGPLENIDGIIFKATLSGDEGNRSLKSNQKIQLTNIKLKVSGEYIDEF